MMKKTIEVNKLREYKGHTGSIFAMDTCDKEDYLFTSGDDGMVVRWDLENNIDDGKGIIRTHCSVYSLKHIADFGMLAVGTSDGTVYLVDLDKGNIIHTYRQTTDSVYHLHYFKKQQQLWIMQGNGFLGVLDLVGRELLLHKRLSPKNLRTSVEIPDSEKVFIGTSDPAIIHMDTSNLNPVDHWKGHDRSVFSLAVHPEGKYLLSGAMDAQIKVWDLQNENQMVKQIAAHLYTVNAISFSPERDHFISASRDKTIKLWDSYSFELLKVIDYARNEGHTHSVNRIKWLKSDNSLISCSDDRRIIRWSLHIKD